QWRWPEVSHSVSWISAQSLPSDVDSAIPALRELPGAFTGGLEKTMMAMVQAWRFPCLCLGPVQDLLLSKDGLEAMLDTLETVPADAACHRTWELRVDFTHDLKEVRWEACSGGLFTSSFYSQTLVKSGEEPRVTVCPWSRVLHGDPGRPQKTLGKMELACLQMFCRYVLRFPPPDPVHYPAAADERLG
ncbi:hypothetical protein HPG69_010693, partial [Diceros bicornis minor]